MTTMTRPDTDFDQWLLDDYITQFTTGDCWWLAWELSQLLGGAQISISTYLDDPDTEPEYAWSHVFVKIDEDCYLDITGLNTRSEMETLWGGSVYDIDMSMARSWSAYRKQLGIWDANSKWGAEGHDAHKVALELLDELGM